MNRTVVRHTLTLLSLFSLGTAMGSAQSAPASAASASPEADDSIITLDAFTVTTDHETYKADDTLAGGRVRTLLRDTPASLSVITAKLMQDLGVTNAQELLIYTNNTEVAGLGGNFSGVVSRGSGVSISGAAENQRLVNPAGTNRARGLTAMDNTRNYFLSDIPWDGYNISRVDVSRGPNSFLFGVGSPSGILNESTNDPSFSDKVKVEARVGSWGSTRESLDFNKVLIPGQVAIRIDLVNDNAEFQQDPAFSHTKRAYGAVRLDPKALSTPSSHTKILANFEHGVVDSNNPRTLPPIDYVTGYLNDKDPRASTKGYNPWTYKFNDGGSDPTASNWTGNGSIGNQNEWSNSPNYYWDAKTGTLLKAGQSGWSAPSSANYGASAAGLNNIYHVQSRGYSSYANATNFADPTKFLGAHDGTVSYLDKTLSDPSVFDFYHKLIDGNNKSEWQRWNAFDVSVVESLFNDRLLIQASADHQDYRSGQQGLLNGRTPVITLDLSSYLLTYPSWLSQAQANPNVGRPFVFGDYGSASESESVRNNYQVTAALNVNFERDFGTKGVLGQILGRHDFTALGGRYTDEVSQNSYKMYGIDASWGKAFNGGTKLSDNNLNFLAYIGPSLLGKSPSGTDLSNLAASLNPSMYPLSSYVKTWTKGTSVDPTAAWTITGADGKPLILTQADNPDNYAGYTGVPATILNSKQNMDQLRTGSSIISQKLTSKALMYQGHFWDDTIIPSFGWREDKTDQRGTVAQQDPTSGLFSRVDSITDTGVSATTRSKSYGLALHLPKAIKKNLPEGTDVSLYYFHGANETPKVRYGIDGSQLPNESGKTDDYSVQIDALKGHATLRLTYFKTQDTNAAASSGQPLGTNGWLIDALPAWTLTFAASAIAVQQYGVANVPTDLQNNNWYWQWAVDHPDVAQQIAAALKTDFANMFPQSYWDQYGSNVDIAAVKRGDWLHVLKNQAVPYTWLTTGSHQIHGQFAIIDQSIESKGFELEATIRPVKNWDITFNGSRATAKQTGLGDAAARYLTGMAKLWLGTAIGKTAVWGGYTDIGSAKTMFLQNLWAPYLTQVALTGSDQPEWSKLKFNTITNYTFDHGFAKGFNVGGAFRWEDKRIIGYGIHQATVYDQKAWIADVNQPIYGSTEAHFDSWIGYSHKLTSKIDWRIQLNLQNVGEKVHLVTVSVEPDGTTAQSRIANGTTFNLTNTLTF